jgi:hypothetical protein
MNEMSDGGLRMADVGKRMIQLFPTSAIRHPKSLSLSLPATPQ